MKRLHFISLVQINNREPVYEIRSWNKDHTEMGDGITLTPAEIRKLKAVCEKMDFRCIDGRQYENKPEEGAEGI